MPAELLTLSKAGPNRKLRPRNETIPPRLSLLRGLDRDRYRRTPCPADLSAGRADHGIKAFAHLAKSHLAGGAPIYRQWNETRLGFRLALAHGGGDFCLNSNGIWTWTITSLRPRIERNGPGNWHHAGDRRHRVAGRQNLVFPDRTFPPPPLGH